LDFVIFEKGVDSVIFNGFANDIILIFFGSVFGSERKRGKVKASLKLNIIEGRMESLEEIIGKKRQLDSRRKFYHCNFFLILFRRENSKKEICLFFFS